MELQHTAYIMSRNAAKPQLEGTAEPEITVGGFPTKFQFFRPNAEMIGNFVRTNVEKK
jgi:hypothetical protein